MTAPEDPPGERPPPSKTGSIDVQLSDPALPVARKRATTASVITGVAERVVHAAEAIGEKVGDVVGESLSHLPVVPKTRRGRVLARSILVSFCLVFAWISVIVGLQLRGRRPPDLRPDAERVLIALRDRPVKEVYLASSSRFQEVVHEDSFTAQMEDMNRTLGNFREITAVIATKTNRGPGGRTGRVDLRLEFEGTATKASLSFRWEKSASEQAETWKLLGLSVEVPPALMAKVGTDEARRERVQGNAVELRALVTDILTRSFAGQVDLVWRDAAPAFQEMPLETFRRNEADSLRTLGGFNRVLSVTSARINPSQTNTSVDLMLEFDYAPAIKGSFEFTKIDGAWRMFGYKLFLPLPHIPS